MICIYLLKMIFFVFLEFCLFGNEMIMVLILWMILCDCLKKYMIMLYDDSGDNYGVMFNRVVLLVGGVELFFVFCELLIESDDNSG